MRATPHPVPGRPGRNCGSRCCGRGRRAHPVVGDTKIHHRLPRDDFEVRGMDRTDTHRKVTEPSNSSRSLTVIRLFRRNWQRVNVPLRP